jgi:hypothetical protein
VSYYSNIYLNIFIAICNQSCVHGICAEPYVCTCQPGWNGTACDQRKFKSCKITNELYENGSISAICAPGCVNGNCTAPNYCTSVYKISSLNNSYQYIFFIIAVIFYTLVIYV